MIVLAGLGFALALAMADPAASAAVEADAAVEPWGPALGRADAPVTLVEYGSVGCSHCADWHADAWPAVAARVDAGDVRFIYRNMVTGPEIIAVPMSLLAACAPADRYYDAVHALFEGQAGLVEAIRAGEGRAGFLALAAEAGFSEAETLACLNDPVASARLQSVARSAAEAGVGSTPTFLANGVRLDIAPAPDGSGAVWTAEGEALVDAHGPIDAAFEGESFERIILYFMSRAAAEPAPNPAPGPDE